MKARNTQPRFATFAPADRARLRAMLDVIPLPLPALGRLERITAPPELVVALNYFGELRLAAWRAWQHAGGPRPPTLLAHPVYGGHWLNIHDAGEMLAGLYALAEEPA